MFSWYEIAGERADPKETGQVRLNTFYETRKKPLWLVVLKLLGLAAMVSVGFFLVLPYIPLPPWQSVAVTSGAMLVYVGIAFFIRPEPNGNNMGFLGGLLNDPMHYSDDINRALWSAHCVLGPGRFVAETLLDLSTHLGLTAEITAEQANQEEMEKRRAEIQRDLARSHKEIAARLEQRRREAPRGQVELSSRSYLDPDRFEV